MAKKKPKKEKRVRVNIRLPPDLVEWVKEYASSRNTTLTQVVVDKLTEIQAENAV